MNGFLLQRQASPDTATTLLPKDAQQFATTEGSKAFRTTVRIAFADGQTANAEVVMLLFEEGDQPFAILSWRDDLTDMNADNRS